MTAKEYRLQISVKNNRILRHIDDSDAGSIFKFCEARSLNYQAVIALIGMRIPAMGKSGRWIKAARDLAAACGVEPEDLFTQRQAAADIVTTVEREISEEEIISLQAPESARLTIESGEDRIISKITAGELLSKLDNRRRDVVAMKHGIGCDEHTFEEIGEKHGVSTQRAIQLYSSALEKMRKGKNGKPLIIYRNAYWLARKGVIELDHQDGSGMGKADGSRR